MDRRAAGALLVVLAALAWCGAPVASQEATAGLTIEAAPRWGGVPPGTWTPYTVTLDNNGSADVDGEVVLVPGPGPAAGAPAGPFDVSVNGRLGVAVAMLDVTAVSGPGSAPPAPTRWPSYRVAVTLAAGARKAFDQIVLEAPYGYRAELRDVSGKVLARQMPTPGTAVGRLRYSVAVLGATDRVTFGEQAPPASIHAQLHVVHVEPEDVPADLLALTGLQVVYLGDVDTAELSDRQRQTLRDFVALGGSLVLAGGPTGRETVAALPDELVPLRPTGTTTVPATALAGPAGSAGSATVATGPVSGGTAVVQSADGTPLVVQRDYGTGRVVQLTYDPFAEPFTADLALGASALEAGLRPALANLETRTTDEASDALWAPVLDRPAASPDRAWPAWATGLLAAYVLLLGPVAWVVARRRPRLARVAVPAAVVALTGMMGLAGGAGAEGPAVARNLVSVRTVGAGGATLVSTYEGRVGRPPTGESAAARATSLTVRVPAGAVASTVVAEPTLSSSAAWASRRAAPTRALGQPATLAGLGLDRLATPAVVARTGAGTVLNAADGSSVVQSGPVGDGRIPTLQTLRFERTGAGVETTVRVSGPAGSAARLSGTIVNRTGRRLRSVSFQLPGKRAAVLGGTIEPGATRTFDAALVGSVLAGDDLAARNARSLAVAARMIGPAPGRAALVARLDPPAGGDAGTRLEILVAAAPYISD